MIDDRDYVTLWVCTDCYYAHNGVTEEEMGRSYPGAPRPLTLIGPEDQVTTGLMAEEHVTPCGSFESPTGDFLGGECECERVTFSWTACDGCGSTLGGSREALTLWLAAVLS